MTYTAYLMHSISNYKRNYLLFALVTLNCFFSFSQIDSVKFFQEKISKLVEQPNFSENNFEYIDNLNQLSYYQRLIAQDSMLVNSERALELSIKNNYTHG